MRAAVLPEKLKITELIGFFTGIFNFLCAKRQFRIKVLCLAFFQERE